MLELKLAEQILTAALAHARAANMKPLCVAVLDAGGALVALKREDGASFLRPEVASAKAWGALGMGTGTRALAARAQSHPAFIGAMGALTAGRIVPVPGGVLIRAADRAILGAVGISGELSENDEACAVAGIEAAGMSADTGA
jgi:uncharacterized protein GlcG (DUF336 family)